MLVFLLYIKYKWIRILWIVDIFWHFAMDYNSLERKISKMYSFKVSKLSLYDN